MSGIEIKISCLYGDFDTQKIYSKAKEPKARTSASCSDLNDNLRLLTDIL